MPIVRITEPERWLVPGPVRYSLSNGFNTSEFDPGEFYDVPPHVVRGMMARGWAELATKEQLGELAQRGAEEAEAAQRPHDEPSPEPMPRRPVEEPRRDDEEEKPPRPPRRYDDDDNGDDDDVARAGERHDPRPRRKREAINQTGG